MSILSKHYPSEQLVGKGKATSIIQKIMVQSRILFCPEKTTRTNGGPNVFGLNLRENVFELFRLKMFSETYLYNFWTPTIKMLESQVQLKTSFEMNFKPHKFKKLRNNFIELTGNILIHFTWLCKTTFVTPCMHVRTGQVCDPQGLTWEWSYLF